MPTTSKHQLFSAFADYSEPNFNFEETCNFEAHNEAMDESKVMEIIRNTPQVFSLNSTLAAPVQTRSRETLAKLL